MKLESIEEEKKVYPMIETVEELHSCLAGRHCDFNRVDKLWYYVVEFIDIATDSVLFCSCYDSPVLALRELPAILEKTKSASENILIELRYACPKSSDVSDNCCTFHDVYLSPYIYFKKPAENSQEVTENK